MRKSHQAGRQELHLAELPVQSQRRILADNPEDTNHDKIPGSQGDDRRQNQRQDDFADTAHIEGCRSDADADGADDTTDQGMGRTARYAVIPGKDIPDNRADEGGYDDFQADFSRIEDQVAANGLSDAGADHGPGEIEARCHHDGVARCNGPRRYARRDGIGRIVEAINIIKENGQQNDGPN